MSIADRGESRAPHGRFGEFGGRYVPETLVPALDELEAAWLEARADDRFAAELKELLERFVGRRTPLGEARRLTQAWGGARVLLKREDLCHTGAHKINNTLGQALLAKRMGKTRVIAETGAGQHGVATATACALFGLECVVYMGELDVQRQALNVLRMKLLGATVRPVSSGSRTLKDAMNEAIRDWVTNVRNTHYIIGSVAGPHPYPSLVRDLQSVIGHEARAQCLEQEGRLPDAVVACVGGGSNAMGMFTAFLGDASVRLVAVEAAGYGLSTGAHGASLGKGRPGVLHGSRSFVLQTSTGQIAEAHSISAGLDYPGVGPELARLKEEGRIELASATDQEALEAFDALARTEGIIPALESAHAVAHARKLAKSLGSEKLLVVNLSGRGDKDVAQLESLLVKPKGRAHKPPKQAKQKTAKRGHAKALPADLRGSRDRLRRSFERCRSEKRAALIAYVMAGDPTLRASEQIARACLDAGADILELGVPFSDPIADGPVIQRAGQRALAAGTTVEDCLELARRLRRNSRAPIALMSYLNPLLSLGEQEAAELSAASGVDALIVPDSPAEESPALAAAAREAGLGWVSFVSPLSTPERIEHSLSEATGFVYFLSVAGVTGARSTLPEDLPPRLAALRKVSSAPVAIGFGISTPQQAQELGRLADGVIVGSAIVSRIEKAKGAGAQAKAVYRFVRSLRRALDKA